MRAGRILCPEALQRFGESCFEAMRMSFRRRHAVSVCAALALLAGCGGGSPSLTTPAGSSSAMLPGSHLSPASRGKRKDCSHARASGRPTVRPTRSRIWAAAVTSTSGLRSMPTAISDWGCGYFDHARGKPRAYSASSMSAYQACAYDNLGNLYVSGTARYLRYNSFTRLSASPNRSMRFPWIKLWWLRPAPVGRDAAYGRQYSLASNCSVHHQRATRDQHGSDFIPGRVCAQYWVTGNNAVVPGLGKNRQGYYNHWIYYFAYPAGGVRRQEGPHSRITATDSTNH